ncbi:hypothetical protein O7605_29790 [Verrucosispora sp. WMMA2121]|uniref:hypothetical protein n=1 Tax=Verrucosispora sp. WMMA2121 TaxID=3015164 RepID=UPI0022B6325E|nr:hypothetical protein [Verrucosispora sp. WMMA2121]MCZ7423707.1 hypothetical protein [Verrucosispora sp. WMMA2121]
MNRDGRPKLAHAQLVIDFSADPARGEQAIGQWFESGWRLLGGSLRDVADAQAAGTFVRGGKNFPYGVDAWLARVPCEGQSSNGAPYDPQEWRRFLNDARRGGAQIHDISVYEMAWSDVDGRPAKGVDISPRMLSIRCVRRHVDGREFVLLSLEAPRTNLLDAAEHEATLSTFFRRAADQAGPLFGQIGFDYGIYSMTGLEYRLYIQPQESIREVGQVLRGYSWVTVLPDILVDRLGGGQQLVDSGAFIAVDRLSSGSWWLQAADTAAGYTNDHAKRVFRALRPVLPAKAYASTFEADLR